MTVRGGRLEGRGGPPGMRGLLGIAGIAGIEGIEGIEAGRKAMKAPPTRRYCRQLLKLINSSACFTLPTVFPSAPLSLFFILFPFNRPSLAPYFSLFLPISLPPRRSLLLCLVTLFFVFSFIISDRQKRFKLSLNERTW